MTFLLNPYCSHVLGNDTIGIIVGFWFVKGLN